MSIITKFLGKWYNGTSKEKHIYCRRCGKRLYSTESKVLGIGLCCYKKELTENKNKLF